MPDGQAPGTRISAAANVDAVNATGSFQITLNNLRIIGGHTGVNGSSASALQVLNSEVVYSNEGIMVNGSSGVLVDNTDLTNIVRTGVNGGWWSANATVNNSRVTNGNMVGMHKGSEGEIFFGDGSGASVTNNTITNGGKTGIFVGHTQGALVKGNTINGACLIHADCGGIYTFARDKLPLNTRIENNQISNVNGVALGPWGPERYGIYLDDHSNGVTVIGNTVTDSDNGMLIHGGFNNVVSGNTFRANVSRHLFYSDSGFAAGSMFNNSISNNTFVGPVIAHVLIGSGVESYATFSGNTYTNYGSSPIGNPSYLPY
jgi:parallel beta-helix repeat protein